MQITLQAKKEYNKLLELIYDNPLNAYEIAAYLKMNGRQAARYKIDWLIKMGYVVAIDSGATGRSKIKWYYKSLRKSLPHGNEDKIKPLADTKYDGLSNPWRNDKVTLQGKLRTINLDKLPYNTAKGILGKRSAFIGNSLETMSF